MIAGAGRQKAAKPAAFRIQPQERAIARRGGAV
jgi:hypothetical protein